MAIKIAATEPTGDFKITIDDIRSVDWQEVVGAVPQKECRSFYTAFHSKAEAYKVARDEVGMRVYLFLSHSLIEPHGKGSKNPFDIVSFDDSGVPKTATKRLTEAELTILDTLYEEVQSPEIKARWGDILWNYKKDRNRAEEAVHFYLESAKMLDDGVMKMWVPTWQRLVWALNLTGKFGKHKELLPVIKTEINALIERYKGSNHTENFCHILIRLLASHGIADPAVHVPILETIGQQRFADRN